MTGAGFFQLVLLCVVLVVTVIPLGRYMAAVYSGGKAPGDRFFDPIERVDLPHPARRRAPRAALERLHDRPAGVQRGLVPVRLRPRALPGRVVLQPDEHGRGAGVRRVQRRRQLHDQHQLAVVLGRADDEPPDPDARAWRCRTSCRPPPAWRSRSRSSAASPAAAGARSATSGSTSCARRCGSCCRCRSSSPSLLAAGGVVQNFAGFTEATPVDAAVAAEASQSIPGGPVASQIAIKQLGTNGGGFYNTNSAHPFENPTPITNFIETVGDPRHPVRASSSCTGGWSARRSRPGCCWR